MLENLAIRWQNFLADYASAEAIQNRFVDLAEQYREPARHYHTLDHVRAVLHHIDTLWPEAPPALYLAGFLHDVIYDPRASDNEARSADLAQTWLAELNVPHPVCNEMARLILLTQTHATSSKDQSGGVFLDADLAILAGPQQQYDAYAAAIRREFSWVPEADYRTGRSQVLQRFLGRSHLFFTPSMHGDAEAQARRNLAREIEQLLA